MKFFSLIFILLAASVAAFSQEGSMLTGIVRDANGPVAGATVTAMGPIDRSRSGTKTAVSQADGSYYLGFTGYGMFRISAFIETNGVRYESRLNDPIELKFANETKLDIDLYKVGTQIASTVSGQAVFGTQYGDGINRPRVTLTSRSDPSVEFVTEGDSDGNFRFENIPVGKYKLRSGGGNSSIAMSGERSINIRTGENSGIIIIVILELTTEEHVNIAVGSLQAPEAVSKSVDKISGQEMRDRADITLIDSLRTIPGFRVQQSGGFGRIASIKTRGLRNQDTAILIDGIRFRDASAISGDATSFLSDFTLTNVAEVEVLRGSGSSLYGTNAIGGTVDFQTPRARQGTHGQISGAFGGLGMGRFRGNLSHGADRFGFSGGVSRTAYTKGIDSQDNASNTNLNARVDVEPAFGFGFSGRLYFTDARVRLNVSPDTLGTLPTSNLTIIDANSGVNLKPDANDPDSIQTSRAIGGQFRAHYLISSKFSLDGDVQVLKTKRRNDDGPLGPGFQSAYASIFDGTVNTGAIRGNWNPVNWTTVVAGYEVESERFANDGLTPTGTSTYNVIDRQTSHSFFVRDTASFFDRSLNLSGGVRYQRFSLDIPTCVPAACPTAFTNITSPPSAFIADGSAAYYFKRSGTKIRVHVGNGYRVPSLYERFGSYFFFGAFFPLGNPQLKPEKSIAFDGGVDQFIANDKVKLTATYFYTEIKDEISYLPTDNLGAPSYYNFDKHFSRGLEFSSTFRPTGSTDIFASYTFTNGDVRNFRRQTPMPPYNIVSRDQKVFGVPDHQFTFSATQRFKRFWVNFDLLATSSYLAPIFSNSTFSTYTYRFTGNRRGDLTAGHTFPIKNEKMSLRLFGTIENVFNHDYFENGFRTAKANARAGVNFSF